MAISIAVSLHQPSLPLPYDSTPIHIDGDEQPRNTVDVTTTTIRATIIVKFTKPVKVARLSARFVSRQWLDNDEDDSKCGTFGLFSINKVLSEGYVNYAAGLHTVDTSFDLPSWLPPTFNSRTSKMTHLVIAKLETPSPLYFNLKRNTRVAAQELVIIKEPPTTLNALRYWSGERRSAGTSLAVKTARFGRVDGKLKVSMRVKSLEQLTVCEVDIIQEEMCCTDLPDSSAWHKLPGSSTSENVQVMPFLSSHDPNTAYTIRRHPIPTVSTTFTAPEPEDPSVATLSQLSLSIKLSGHDLRPNFTSPLLSVRHKVRIRFKFQNPSSKEIVVNIPITLFEGPASCDDIPPLYEDIYSDGRRSRASSVATLPLYVKSIGSSIASSECCPEAWLDRDIMAP